MNKGALIPVLASIFILCSFSFAQTFADSVQTDYPVSISCTSSGQLCEPLFLTEVETQSELIVKFTAHPAHCSNVGVKIFLDGTQVGETGFLGPSMSETIDLGPVSPGTYEIGLQGVGQTGGCNFGDLLSWGGTLTVFTSTATNQPPVADAGDNQIDVKRGTTVILDGTGSFDPDCPDKSCLTFEWEMDEEAGENFESISSSDKITASFTLNNKCGNYAVDLIVTDDKGEKSIDHLTITPEDELPDVFFVFSPLVPIVGELVDVETIIEDDDGDLFDASMEILTPQNLLIESIAPELEFTPQTIGTYTATVETIQIDCEEDSRPGIEVKQFIVYDSPTTPNDILNIINEQHLLRGLDDKQEKSLLKNLKKAIKSFEKENLRSTHKNLQSFQTAVVLYEIDGVIRSNLADQLIDFVDRVRKSI